jgi:hypothetical protein
MAYCVAVGQRRGRRPGAETGGRDRGKTSASNLGSSSKSPRIVRSSSYI